MMINVSMPEINMVYVVYVVKLHQHTSEEISDDIEIMIKYYKKHNIKITRFK